MCSTIKTVISIALFLWPLSGPARTPTPARGKPRVYTVATAHFDTQYNWDVQTSIRHYLSKTLDQNLFLLDRYPDYIFNFEGGIKYRWMKEYYPRQYERVKEYVRQGRWHITGSSWDANDVIIPSPESATRNILYGQMFYQEEFGVRGTDLFLPDCFGFGWTLPSIAAHSGLVGFSTAKLNWRSRPFYADGSKIPFDIGLWQGIDGSRIILVANPRSYTTRWSGHDISHDETLASLAGPSPLNTLYHYYGVGDTGGAPSIGSVISVEKGIKGDGPVEIISATSDMLYRNYLPLSDHPELPVYDGELLMDVHGTGCYTSEGVMKLYNRKNEQLGDGAERAAVVADWTGGQKYPRESITESWRRFIWHQFHDDLTGTSIPRAYEFSWNDELLSQKQFAQTLTSSVGAVSRLLDTRGKGVPVVIYNPVARPVNDILEITVDKFLFRGKTGVYDEKGELVASQLISGEHGDKLLIAADVRPLSFTVYELRSNHHTLKTSLKTTANSLENSVYKVTLDPNGDIASIVDKRNNNRELVRAGKSIRLAMFTGHESFEWPSWEIFKTTIDREPAAIVDDVKITVAENGPVRVALCVERKYGESTFRQYIRLTEGGQDDRIDLVNEIDWKTTGALLKAEFNLNIDNESATYDLGIGSVVRKNNTETAYEVPAQYWADLSAADNSYGVSVMNNGKYGWDKPDNNTLRLTLLHSPATRERHDDQSTQDWGYHTFTYSITGHKGNHVDAQTVLKAEILNRPLAAFISSKHDGELGRGFSFLDTSDDRMMVKALKKAEKSDDYVIRLYETTGKAVDNFTVTFPSEIVAANELNGVEDVTGGAIINGNTLTISAGPYSVKTFGVELKPAAYSLEPPVSIPVELDYNIKTATFNAWSADADIDGRGYSYAAELLPVTLRASGVDFKLGDPLAENALKCRGDTINLPQDGRYDKLYLLASCVLNDCAATFYVDCTPAEFIIPHYSGFIGQWRHYGHTEGFFKPAEVAYAGTHRHSRDNGDCPYEFTYMFKYCIDIPEGAKTLVLPDDPRVLLFAASLAANENDDVVPVVDLVTTALRKEDLAPRVHVRQNLLRGKPLIGKSTPDGPYSPRRAVSRPEAAIDGDVSTAWADPADRSRPSWIEVDMEREHTIKGWHVLQAPLTAVSSFHSREYRLEVKLDTGDPWQIVDTVRDNEDIETDRLLSAPVKARYARLTVLDKGKHDWRTAVRIAEFEIY